MRSRPETETIREPPLEGACSSSPAAESAPAASAYRALRARRLEKPKTLEEVGVHPRHHARAGAPSSRRAHFVSCGRSLRRSSCTSERKTRPKFFAGYNAATISRCCEAAQRIELDLAHALAGQSERRPISSSDFGSVPRARSGASPLPARGRVASRRGRSACCGARARPAPRAALLAGERSPSRIARTPTGPSRLAEAHAAARTSRTCFTAASPPRRSPRYVGSRPSFVHSARSAVHLLLALDDCTGIRIVRDLFATPRCTACRIHHVA